ncbi:hypothetical protein ACLOJK_016847 [Asimina triloba]
MLETRSGGRQRELRDACVLVSSHLSGTQRQLVTDLVTVVHVKAISAATNLQWSKNIKRSPNRNVALVASGRARSSIHTDRKEERVREERE